MVCIVVLLVMITQPQLFPSECILGCKDNSFYYTLLCIVRHSSCLVLLQGRVTLEIYESESLDAFREPVTYVNFYTTALRNRNLLLLVRTTFVSRFGVFGVT
jgi:hypothetical protein